MAASINSTRTCQALADLEPIIRSRSSRTAHSGSSWTDMATGLAADGTLRTASAPLRWHPIGTARRVTGAVATETLVDGDRRRPRQPTWRNKFRR